MKARELYCIEKRMDCMSIEHMHKYNFSKLRFGSKLEADSLQFYSLVKAEGLQETGGG